MLVSGLHMASMSLRESALKMESGTTIPSKGDRDEKIKQIRTAFIHRIHLNRPWAIVLGICEVLNFMNILLQIYLTDMFLARTFLDLGQSLAEDRLNGELNPLDVVFPKMTKCTFHKYGPSGTIQKHDALCVMALNIVNEKIYVFLWYWFIILALITGLGLVWRILTMALHSRSTLFNKIVFTMACPGKYNPWNVLKVTHKYYFSDWLFLYYIAKNLDNYVFKELLQKLAEDLEEAQKIRYKTFPGVENEPLTKEHKIV